MRKALIWLVALVAAVSTSFIVAAPPASAGWTSNTCHNAGGWADVCLDWSTTKINAGSYQVNTVQVCMYPKDPNTKELKQLRLQVSGSGGQGIAFLTLGNVGRNQCKQTAYPAFAKGGVGMTGSLVGTVNIDGWVPIPDYPLNMCRKVVVSGNC